jgi:hypothetical protein
LEAWEAGAEVVRGVAHRLLAIGVGDGDGGVNRLSCGGHAMVPLSQVANSAGARRWALNFAPCLLAGGFHVAISGTIGFGRSTVRFATLRLKTRTDFRKPFVAWHAQKRGRVFFLSKGGD